MNFRIVELGDTCEFLDHMRIPVEESQRNPGPYPYYGANGQQGWIDGYIFDEPLVLLAEDGGHFGSKTKPIAYKVTGKCWVNNHAHVLRPRANCDIDYLHRVLSFYDVSRFISGTTRKKLTKGKARRVPIPLPSLPEQRRIAAILSKADRLRRLRRYALELGDSYLQAVFLEMFGDPVTNPMGWDVKKTGTQIESIRYGTGSPPEYQTDGLPFIRATNIKMGTVLRTGLAHISENDALRIAKCRVNTGDLIIVRSGVNSGDCALVPPEFDGAYAAYDLIARIPYPLNYYYNFIINLDKVKSTIRRLSRRAGQPHINADQVKSLRFPIPSFPLQEQFAQIVQRFDRLRAQQHEALRHAEHLFQALLHKTFRGELAQEEQATFNAP